VTSVDDLVVRAISPGHRVGRRRGAKAKPTPTPSVRGPIGSASGPVACEIALAKVPSLRKDAAPPKNAAFFVGRGARARTARRTSVASTPPSRISRRPVEAGARSRRPRRTRVSRRARVLRTAGSDRAMALAHLDGPRHRQGRARTRRDRSPANRARKVDIGTFEGRAASRKARCRSAQLRTSLGVCAAPKEVRAISVVERRCRRPPAADSGRARSPPGARRPRDENGRAASAEHEVAPRPRTWGTESRSSISSRDGERTRVRPGHWSDSAFARDPRPRSRRGLLRRVHRNAFERRRTLPLPSSARATLEKRSFCSGNSAERSMEAGRASSG